MQPANDFRRNWGTHSVWLKHVATRLRNATTKEEKEQVADLLEKKAEEIKPKRRERK